VSAALADGLSHYERTFGLVERVGDRRKVSRIRQKKIDEYEKKALSPCEIALRANYDDGIYPGRLNEARRLFFSAFQHYCEAKRVECSEDNQNASEATLNRILFQQFEDLSIVSMAEYIPEYTGKATLSYFFLLSNIFLPFLFFLFLFFFVANYSLHHRCLPLPR
jgi:hypothetical protein